MSSAGSDAPDAMKIVHKEQDQLMCFCVNQVQARFTARLRAVQMFVSRTESCSSVLCVLVTVDMQVAKRS